MNNNYSVFVKRYFLFICIYVFMYVWRPEENVGYLRAGVKMSVSYKHEC